MFMGETVYTMKFSILTVLRTFSFDYLSHILSPQYISDDSNLTLKVKVFFFKLLYIILVTS